jgi:hypothetical protein
MKRFLVTFIKARSTAHGTLIIEPDNKVFGPHWPIDNATLEDAIKYLSTRGFFNDMRKAWVLPGAILSVQELSEKSSPAIQNATIRSNTR